MEPRLTGIQENEALLYLGYRGGTLPPDIHEIIAECEQDHYTRISGETQRKPFPGIVFP